jgi:hypothetical protein
MNKFTYKIIKDNNDLFLMITHIQKLKVEKVSLSDNALKVYYNIGKTFVIPNLRDAEIKEIKKYDKLWIVEFDRLEQDLVKTYETKIK